jgi:hypothetical protein
MKAITASTDKKKANLDDLISQKFLVNSEYPHLEYCQNDQVSNFIFTRVINDKPHYNHVTYMQF